jgi:hypothetical protein
MKQLHHVHIMFPGNDLMRFAMSGSTRMLGQPIKLSRGPPNFELGAIAET